MNKTSWGKVANWYDNFIEKTEDSYQKQLILPNLLRLLELKRGEVVLDLACGQGFFANEFAKAGTKVIGVDVASELINIAKQSKLGEYYVASADNISFLKDGSIDKAVIILSLQNIQNVSDTIKESARVLKPKGKIYIVLNHPAFRIPKRSSWGWDDAGKTQYRRLDAYLSESKEAIQMHPGENPKLKTVSLHRPLQFYFKMLSKNGLFVSRLEEWNSNKVSEPGPKKEAEDKARKEFPLFLFLEAVKQ